MQCILINQSLYIFGKYLHIAHEQYEDIYQKYRATD